ncbi:MAG: hypothetical protein UR91_C0035G0003 [Candidatus Nomurabacteria bacterium GW2011_GWC2_35_8]|uniref:Uncharacterized protein n=2 Tax=Candidatus Nomuraibacteriota TaxID=1752729 RepID=A0A1F6YHQ2_9BACT|nr:MAG: hypothetical protein UR91_C0035G0003 [Candidatus Nomurabacteria bacterium GW2011_GWC2_35_8]OGJ05918.1 MAG: hypothetical protein A2192_01635 [Candidatus Nomurabacteria bacterium RIFOXYA1_FULL_35_17]OGJ13697.1 MAG: hypothetical protein A2554_00915 [Candidatus Nomurabacteria bacterium RIFOXYD2_FULL_35_12]
MSYDMLVVMRYRFNDIFQTNPDGSLSPRRPLHINGVTFGYGVSFNRGVAFGGVDFFNFRGRDIEADDTSGVLNIRGFYNA